MNTDKGTTKMVHISRTAYLRELREFQSLGEAYERKLREVAAISPDDPAYDLAWEAYDRAARAFWDFVDANRRKE